MKLLHHIKDSIYGPAFYSKQKVAPIGQAFGYFFKLLLIISALATLLIALFFGPKVSRFMSTAFVSEVVSYYPAELEITLKGGHAMVNVEEPYTIPIPVGMGQDKGMRNSPVVNLLVIDTTHPLVIENFAQYKTAVLLTKDFLVFQENDGKITIESLAKMPDMTVNRATVSEFISKVVPYLKVVIPFLLVGIFIAWFLGNTVAYLFILLITSLILWIVYKLQKKQLSYGTCYKLGLYATTAALVADLVFTMAQIHLPWYIDIIIILIVVFANEHEASSSH
jgi:hypothetical protein